MKNLWKFGLMGVGFVALWMVEITSTTTRNPHEDWREAERKIQEEKRRIRESFDPRYSAAWRDLNLRIQRYNLADWGGMFLVLGGSYAFSCWSERSIFPALFLCCMVAVLLYGRSYFGVKVNEFRCPRCEKPFIHIDPQAPGSLYKIHKSARRGTQCQSCKLPLWARNCEDLNPRKFAEHQSRR